MVRPTFIHHSSACGRIAPQNVAFQFQIVPGSRSIHLTDSTNLALHATNFSRPPVIALIRGMAVTTAFLLEEGSPSMRCGHTRIRFLLLRRLGGMLRSIPSG